MSFSRVYFIVPGADPSPNDSTWALERPNHKVVAPFQDKKKIEPNQLQFTLNWLKQCKTSQQLNQQLRIQHHPGKIGLNAKFENPELFS